MTARGKRTISLLAALLLAVLWWLAALWFGQATGVAPWADQRSTFTTAVTRLADPYPGAAWPYVPWAVVRLIPFGLIPVAASILLQMMLYFGLLALIITRFGGGVGTVLLVLTSAIAFDTALEINIEWIVCIGLIVPRAWSGPFLLVKPQVALGYWLGFRPRQWIMGGLVVLVVLLISLALWGWWPPQMWADIQTNTLGDWGTRINLAPSAILPRPVAWLIGLGLALLALRRHDVILGVLAWVCVMPYIALYSLLPAFALAAIRWPRPVLIFSGTLWLLYGGVFLAYLTG